MDACSHRVNLDRLVSKVRSGKIELSTICERCGAPVTLDGVLSELVRQVGALDRRVDRLEEGSHVRPD